MKKTLPLLVLLSLSFSEYTTAQWTTDGSGNLYNNNKSNAGFVGIGTGTIATPQAQLEVRSLSLPSTAGSTMEIARFTGVTGNGSEFRFSVNRFASGTDWTTANTRMQAWTDVTPQGYIDFNPNGSLAGVALGSGSNEYMRILSNGNIGIWTTSPTTSFEVHSSTALATTAGSTNMAANFYSYTGDNSQLQLLTTRFAAGNSWLSASTRIQAVTDATNQGYLEFNPNGATYGIALGSQTNEIMRLLSSGNVLIGKTSQTNSGYMLDVNGNARMNLVVVNTTGADYVFDSSYHVPSLKDVAAYIRQQHHLQGIPSASEQQKEGLNVGDNQTRLLQKIEELTLYLIDQNKALAELKEQNQDLQQRIECLERAAGQSR